MEGGDKMGETWTQGGICSPALPSPWAHQQPHLCQQTGLFWKIWLASAVLK